MHFNQPFHNLASFSLRQQHSRNSGDSVESPLALYLELLYKALTSGSQICVEIWLKTEK